MRHLRQILVLCAVAFALAATVLVTPAAAAVGAAKPRTLQARAALAKRVAEYAKSFVGVPYVYGGTSPRGFDCSGLIVYAYKKFGVSLPRTTYSLIATGTRVSRRSLRAGDLIFFGAGHMGLYVGNGRFIHSPRTGERVRVDPLAGWWSGRLTAARRVTSF